MRLFFACYDLWIGAYWNVPHDAGQETHQFALWCSKHRVPLARERVALMTAFASLPGMIQIPLDARCVRDSRLTALRTIRTLYEREIEKPGGLKSKIVADMQKKKAGYAESDYVIARLDPGRPRKQIDQAAFYQLFKSKKITEDEFVSAIQVTIAGAQAVLKPADLLSITNTDVTTLTPPVLFTEFRPGISAALADDGLGELIVKMLIRDTSEK